MYGIFCEWKDCKMLYLVASVQWSQLKLRPVKQSFGVSFVVDLTKLLNSHVAHYLKYYDTYVTSL